MAKFIDLTGQRFGKLTVVKRSEERRNDKICWVCDCDCGNKNEIKVGQDLKRGHTKSCGHCNEKRVPGTTIIDLTDKTFSDFIVLGLCPDRTENRQTIWKCKCQKCGVVKDIREGDLKFYNGNYIRCNCSKKYAGEEKIKQLLIENNIVFEEQKIFKGCKFDDTRRPAVFDFYIDNRYVIEYDGEQHFKYRENTGGWNNKENFLRTQERDRFKNTWCFENNIPIIRIPYTHYQDIVIDDLLIDKSTFVIGEEKQ